MPVYCITGTNRGLGLEAVRQLAKSSDNTILATTRPGADLSDIKSVASPSTHIISCDLEDIPSIQVFAQDVSRILAGQKIDFLLNNAGINSTPTGQRSYCLDAAHLARQMAINVIGPAKVVEYLLEAGTLADELRMCNLTSGLGSMVISEQINPRKCCGYSISKAGLNMLSIHLASDLQTRLAGVVVVVVDPGWVKTRLGGAGAVLEPEESVRSLLGIVHGLGHADNGKFFGYEGETKPW